MDKPKILISIRPKWCEKIFNGEKTIEVRRSAPKIDTPFETLVYCTKGKIFGELVCCKSKELSELFGYGSVVGINKGYRKDEDDLLLGKVIGSFVCDRIDEIEPDLEYYSDGYNIDDDRLAETCLSREQLSEYGKGVTLYGWHITEPKLFDRPKELSEFGTVCDKLDNDKCDNCPYLRDDDAVFTWCGVDNIKPLTRAPQSWCYVEEIGE